MRPGCLCILLTVCDLAKSAAGGDVTPEPQVSVKRVRFSGDLVFPAGRLRKALDSGADTLVCGQPSGRPSVERDEGVPRRPGGLPHRGCELRPEAIEAGVVRVRSLYLLAGYLEADVRAEIQQNLVTVFVEA